jgi:release factor glutamine methyltransferase
LSDSQDIRPAASGAFVAAGGGTVEAGGGTAGAGGGTVAAGGTSVGRGGATGGAGGDGTVEAGGASGEAGASVGELLREARRRLAATPFGAAPREAALLLGRLLGASEAEVLAHGERAVPPAVAARFAGLLARRLGGEPFAYLTGEREFYGRPFAVDPRVLIPRPETEHLVEAALSLAGAGELPAAPRVLDLGTGSGAIAVTLSLELPAARVVGTDLSLGALAVAAANVRRHGVGGRVGLAALDLGRGLALARFDLVVSNPPYLDRREAAGLSPEVCNFEPHLALFSAGTGTSTLGRIFRQAAAGLAPGARLAVEIGAGQLGELLGIAEAAGLRREATVEDYAGIPRVMVLSRPQGPTAGLEGEG